MAPSEQSYPVTAARVALLGIATSAALAVAKVGVGLAAHSIATVSDGIESAADVLSSGLVYVGLWIASKPADEDHPYGHGRFEILTGLGVGILLAAMGAGICVNALLRSDLTPTERFAIWPLIASIAIKSVMATLKMRVGRRTNSIALKADALNDSVDILSGGVALVSVLFAVSRFHDADHYGGFVIGVIVIFLGFRVVRETAMQLMDTMPDAARMHEIRTEALRVPGALGIDKCFARKTGLRYHVDLHLEVDPNLTVMESHEIARAVKHHLKTRLEWVADVLVHVEPHQSVVEHVER